MDTKNNTRRNFFKLGAMGALLAASGLSSLNAAPHRKELELLNFDRSKQKALLLSSSGYKDTGFLNHAVNWLKDFVKQNNLQGKQVAFIPYASVRSSYDNFELRVQKIVEPLGLKIVGVHRGNPKEIIEKSSAIFVGGGNTFKLVSDMYQNDLIELISKRVSQGIPYAGWSAGANVAGATMKTTNDMPIIEPHSFNTFNIFPHQINPHFISGKPVGHNGESREERLEEFLLVNPKSIVYALPEGVALLINGLEATVLGMDKNAPLLKMEHGKEIQKIAIGTTFNY